MRLLGLFLICLSLVTADVVRNDILAKHEYGTGVNLAFGGAMVTSISPPPWNTNPLLSTYIPTLDNIFETNSSIQNMTLSLLQRFTINPFWGFKQQIGALQQLFQHTPFATDSLFLVVGGNSDVTAGIPYNTIATQLMTHITTLITSFQAKTIVITQLIAPNSDETSVAFQAWNVSTQTIITGVNDLATQYPSTQIVLWDPNMIVQTIQTNPETYGITEFTTVCQSPSSPYTSSCNDTQLLQSFFYDGMNPTTKVHQILANDLMNKLMNMSVMKPSQWFTIGDSLADIGNFVVFGNMFGSTVTFPPVQAYPNGTFTNGLNFVGYIAQTWGLPQSKISDILIERIVATTKYGNGINMAAAGACANKCNSVSTKPPFNFSAYADAWWDLSPQITHIQSIHAVSYISRDALHVIWIGANDVFKNQAVDSGIIESWVNTLWNTVNARRFLILTLPDITLTPEGKKIWGNTNATVSIRQLITEYNQNLTSFATRFNTANGMSVLIVDAASVFVDIFANAPSYGYTNTVDPCLTSTGLCSNSSAYIFWDNVHPTTRVAKTIAQAAYTTIIATWKAPKQWFMYGDSLSDEGNLNAVAKAYKTVYPPPPYYQGKFSDGPVWSTYLGQLFSAPLSLSHTTRVVPSRVWGTGYNFASGGAMTGALINGIRYEVNYDATVLSYIRQRGSRLPWSMPNEINEGKRQTSMKGIPFHPDALHFIWIGGNDYLIKGNFQTDVYATVTAIIGAVQNISTQLGGTRFLVGLMPNLAIAPAFISQNPTTLGNVQYAIQQHNQNLQTNLQTWAKSQPHIQLAFMDAYTLLAQVINNATAYGFQDVTHACSAAPKVCNTTAVPHLFWDQVHPTTYAHRILANDTYQKLASQGIIPSTIPQWFTWGDSLSDPGNNWIMATHESPAIYYPPSPYYVNGHFSNGPAFAERLGEFLNLPQRPIALDLLSELPPPIIIPTPKPQPTLTPTSIPTLPSIPDGQSLGYMIAIDINGGVLSRGDDLSVVMTRLATKVALALQLDPTLGNVIITVTAPSYVGYLIFRASDPTIAAGYARAYANPVNRADYIMVQPDLTNLIVTDNTVIVAAVNVVPCGTNGYKAVDNPYCSSDVLPSPSSASSSSNNTPLIVGLVVGLIGGFIAMIIFYYVLGWCLDKQARQRHIEKAQEMTGV